jgi:hypothetical protein
MRALFALLATFLWSSAVARDYFVARNGDDEALGTRGSPWHNIQDAIDRLKPGDTLHIGPGVYREKLYINVSGAPGEPITIKGGPGVVISGRGQEGENMIYIENKSHLRIIGLELRDNLGCKDGSGIRIYGTGTDIELRDNRIHEIRGTDAMGITVYGTDAKRPVSKLLIDGNRIFNCEPAPSEALTLNGNVESFVVSNNVVHDCNNIGIDFIGGEDWISKHPDAVTRDGICRGNRVARCRSNYEDGYAAGIYVDSGRNITIEDNFITECDLGIEVGAENKGFAASGIIVRNNTVYHNDKAGIVFGGYEEEVGRVTKSKFTGNVCYQNGRHRSEHNGELWIQWASGNEVSGNTFISQEGKLLVNVEPGGQKGNSVDGNRYFTSAGAAAAEFLWGGHDVVGFAAWRQTSNWDVNSRFGEVPFTPPAATLGNP